VIASEYASSPVDRGAAPDALHAVGGHGAARVAQMRGDASKWWSSRRTT
jgi:hypothetical protein